MLMLAYGQNCIQSQCFPMIQFYISFLDVNHTFWRMLFCFVGCMQFHRGAFSTSVCNNNAEERRSDFKPRPPATMACVKTSALRNGRAISEWLASTCTWAAMTARLQQLKPLTRQSCCAMSTAVTARLLCLLSPISLLSTTRSVCLLLTAVACVPCDRDCSCTGVVSDTGSSTCQGGLSLEHTGNIGVLRSCAVFLLTMSRVGQNAHPS